MPDARNNDGRIARVQDLLDLIARSGIAARQKAHVRLWFRGQPRSEWQLAPGVYRPKFPAKDEAARLNVERHLCQDFRVECAGVLSGKPDDAELYFLQQHYRMPTRLLDWTVSPLAALYFAATQEPDADGAVFMMDAYMLAHTQGAKAHFEGVMTSRHPIFREALRVIFDWRDPKRSFPGFVLPVRPDHFERRVMLQKGCFTFHPTRREKLTKSENTSLRSFFIPKAAKLDITDELFLLGIDAFSIYGDLESLAERLKFAYKIT
jgi:hypothetical protein